MHVTVQGQWQQNSPKVANEVVVLHFGLRSPAICRQFIYKSKKQQTLEDMHSNWHKRLRTFRHVLSKNTLTQVLTSMICKTSHKLFHRQVI